MLFRVKLGVPIRTSRIKIAYGYNPSFSTVKNNVSFLEFMSILVQTDQFGNDLIINRLLNSIRVTFQALKSNPARRKRLFYFHFIVWELRILLKYLNYEI